MKRFWIFALLILPASGFGLTADQIMDKVDDNMTFSSMSFEATMSITKGSRTLTKEFFGYGTEDEETFYMEYTNSEDEGTKYLKIDDEMWIYFPDADDTMKISGHLLSDSMMGSDISYEDMMNNEALMDDYDATLNESTNIDGSDCYAIQLDANNEDVTYYKQIAYVDESLFVIRYVEYYSKSGRLLKTIHFEDFENVSGHNYAMKMTISDERKSNSETVIEYTDLTFDASIDDKYFTLSYLER